MKAITPIFISSLLILSSFGCSRSITGTEVGALAGAALGAGTGAIIGSQTGDAGRGVAIGAGLGALGGGLLGNSVDGERKKNKALEAQMSKNQELIQQNQLLIDELRKRGADVRSSDRGVVINLPDILFGFDRSTLTPAAKRTVDEISSVLSEVKNRHISVEGHTDSIGTVSYNKDLSERRAANVRGELTRRGIPGSQISSVGYGEGSPIATNNTDMGRSRNRRVEIVIENN